MNISYTKKGDYLLPDLILKDKERFNIGKYGLLKLEYLKKNKRELYIELLMKDKLNEYLCDIDITLIDKEQNLIKEHAEKENITEELKSNNQMLWIGKMYNIKNRVEEIILKEYIYVWYKEFEEIYLPFYNNVNDYLNNYVIPDLVAFYLSNGYSRHCLSDCPLRNHINSAIDIFNCKCDISRLITKIKEILKIKYNLIIVKDNPMILKKYY